MSIDSIVKPLLEFLKQPLRYSIGLGVVAAITLFTPDSIINQLGLLKLRNEGKPYLGVVLLLSIAVAVASFIGWSVTKYNGYRLSGARKKRLHRLTIQEKQILRAYIEGQTRSLTLDITSGVVSGLVSESIIYRSSNLGRLSGFAHNIQPWAWDYLNEHRDLLQS